MGTDLVPRAGNAIAFSDDQLALIKSQICRPRNRDATDDELAMFIGQCERTGLDPFDKQIYAIFRNDKRAGAEKMTIQVAIDGLRLAAERTGKYVGQDGPFWCDADGNWTDIWLSKEHPQAAKVIVKKVIGGVVAETPAVAHWSEYAISGYGDQFWREKPALMISKCAEALALRKAFPRELSGLYTAEEMARADVPDGPLAELPAAPTVLAPTKGQITKLKGLVTKNKVDVDQAKVLFLEVTGRPLEGRFLQSLSRDEAGLMIDRMLEGALPTGASDLPEVVDGEFVHEEQTVEQIKEAFDATEETKAA